MNATRSAMLILLLVAQAAIATPDDDYRLFARLADLTVDGPVDEFGLGNFQDLAFDSRGTLYGVVRRNNLAVYDAGRGAWTLIDGDESPIVSDLQRGLVTYVRRPDGVRERTVLDPARLPAISGYAEQLAIGPDDRVWVTTHDYTIYRQDGDAWERIPGLAKSIEVGADGSVYAMHAEEAPAPRQDVRRMRDLPKAKRIAKWNGSGWELLPESDIWQIRSLAVDPGGTPWIAYDKWGANGGFSGSVVARLEGGAWQDVSPPGIYIAHGVAIDEHGTLWLDVERDWPGEVRTRAFMTWQGDGWRQEFNGQLGIQNYAFDVYGGLPRLGLFGISDGRPRIADGWVRYPGVGVSNLKLSPNGDVWASRRYSWMNAPRVQSLRWLGGNRWGDGRAGAPKAFFPDGEWVDAYVGLPMNQRRGYFELVTRIDDDSYVGVTLAPQQRAVASAPQMQSVYRVENGRSIPLGDPFRNVAALAADDQGRAWVFAQPRLSGRPPPLALYRWENGAWTAVEVPPGFAHNGDMQRGIDGAVVVTGYRQDAGDLPAIAIWRGESWSLMNLPPRASISSATTDGNGNVWGIGDGGIMHQEGATVSFDSPEPLPAATEAVAAVASEPSAASPPAAPAGGGSADLPSAAESTAAAVAAVAAIEEAAKPRTGNLIGCWAWSNGATITVRDNGMAHNGLSPAPWTANGEREFEIAWPDIVATITLAPDGTTMTEQSLFGNLNGQRVAGSGETFEGVWQLDNGATAVAGADGSYQIGAFKGAWATATGVRRFEVRWPLHDAITVSTDGRTLSGSNQFGAFTATKTSCD